MATDTRAVRSGVEPYRLTGRQVLRMIAAGILPDDAHAGLVRDILPRTEVEP